MIPPARWPPNGAFPSFPPTTGERLPYYWPPEADVIPPPLDPVQQLGAVVTQWTDMRYGDGVGYDLVAGVISRIIDLSGNGQHEIQATPALRLALALGGPNGTPEATPTSLAVTNQRLICVTQIQAANQRPHFMWLQRLRNVAIASMTDVRLGFITAYQSLGSFRWYLDFQTQPDETSGVTNPLFDTNYHLHELAYTAPASARIDGVLVTPQPTTNDTAPQIINSRTGHNSAAAGGAASKISFSRPLTDSERFGIYDWYNRSVVNGYTFALTLPTS